MQKELQDGPRARPWQLGRKGATGMAVTRARSGANPGNGMRQEG
ncbi:hypothetical protein JCM9957A_56710 [Kineosporia succinea]